MVPEDKALLQTIELRNKPEVQGIEDAPRLASLHMLVNVTV